ncbi:SRPBCC family protein [Streptomyces aureocirculatus]|uniref:SRPBCC family protein n=1 Tax=Streptomyces aureocirculatus TaxID=67275 RepID=UPI0004C9E0D8|nr:SRPBCC family protein [Streptomyces aureocirculatus]
MGVVRNAHERVVEASAADVGELLDRLSGPDDPLFPTPAWPAMTFDGPLAVGAAGGHGPVRYAVAEYEPGRRVRFAFTEVTGGTGSAGGFHEISIEPLGERRCRVRHVMELEPRGVERLLWPTVVRPVHDTMVEEVLDNVERAAAGGCARPVRWSRRVRLLNALGWDRPETVAVPEAARLLRGSLERPAYQDAYRVRLLPGLPRDPRAWAPMLRDTFPVLGCEGGELLLRVDVAGLTARASILVDEEFVTLSTFARPDTRRGRLYWGVVRFGHPVMARLMLRRTHRALALAAPSAGDRALTRCPVGRDSLPVV